MRLERLQSFVLSLPQTAVVKQWGDSLVYKVAGKVFFLIAMDGATPEAVVFKCLPEEFDVLTESDAVAQAPYFAKRHWVRVSDLGIFPDKQLQAHIRHSYDLVVAGLPKKVQATLGADVDAKSERAR